MSGYLMYIQALMATYEFGVSIPKSPDNACVLLVPPIGKLTGAVLLITDQIVWKVVLTDEVLSEHRNGLGIPYEPPKKVP
jgi:hypothetical protein